MSHLWRNIPRHHHYYHYCCYYHYYYDYHHHHYYYHYCYYHYYHYHHHYYFTLDALASRPVACVKYSCKVDIFVDKIFLFKLFFLWFFSVCLPNIYFNILEYLSTLDLLSFDKSDYKHFATQGYTAFWHPPSCSSDWMIKHAFMSIFIVGHQRIILTGVLPVVATSEAKVVAAVDTVVQTMTMKLFWECWTWC